MSRIWDKNNDKILLLKTVTSPTDRHVYSKYYQRNDETNNFFILKNFEPFPSKKLNCVININFDKDVAIPIIAILMGAGIRYSSQLECGAITIAMSSRMSVLFVRLWILLSVSIAVLSSFEAILLQQCIQQCSMRLTQDPVFYSNFTRCIFFILQCFLAYWHILINRPAYSILLSEVMFCKSYLNLIVHHY